MMIGAEGFKLLRSYFSIQAQLFRADPDPFTRNPFALGIVVVSPEVILQVSAPVINLGPREHGFFLTGYDKMYSM
jgi:hypothetical protein